MGMSNPIARALIADAKQARVPITVNFELLPICNLDCKMCYIRTDGAEVRRQGGLIPADAWLGLARELLDAGTLFLLLTGGEVFLYPEFRFLYENLVKMGFVLTINTNATLIDGDTVNWLKQFPPKCVSISLYGASNEAYGALCGKTGMFDRVDRAISLLQCAGITVECKTLLTPLNVQEMQPCLDYCRERRIPCELASYAFPPARKTGSRTQVRFRPAEAARCQLEIDRLMSSTEEFEQNIRSYLEKYEAGRRQPGTQQQGLSCAAANSSCWISWQGHMTPCAMLNEPYTLPFQQGFSAAWEALKVKADALLLSPECSFCEKRSVCTVCPAASAAETGAICKASRYHCEMTDALISDMKRYAEAHHLEWRNTVP